MIWVDVGLVVASLGVLVLVALVLWRKAKAALGAGRELQQLAAELGIKVGALTDRLNLDAVPGRTD